MRFKARNVVSVTDSGDSCDPFWLGLNSANKNN